MKELAGCLGCFFWAAVVIFFAGLILGAAALLFELGWSVLR